MERAAIEEQLDSALLTDKGAQRVLAFVSVGGWMRCAMQAAMPTSKATPSVATPLLSRNPSPALPSCPAAEMEAYRANYAKQPDPEHPAYQERRQQRQQQTAAA